MTITFLDNVLVLDIEAAVFLGSWVEYKKAHVFLSSKVLPKLGVESLGCEEEFDAKLEGIKEIVGNCVVLSAAFRDIGEGDSRKKIIKQAKAGCAKEDMKINEKVLMVCQQLDE